MCSVMLPAVDIAWISAFRVAALLTEIPAVSVPMAAGEATQTRREADLEEDIFMEEMKMRERRGEDLKFGG